MKKLSADKLKLNYDRMIQCISLFRDFRMGLIGQAGKDRRRLLPQTVPPASDNGNYDENAHYPPLPSPLESRNLFRALMPADHLRVQLWSWRQTNMKFAGHGSIEYARVGQRIGDTFALLARRLLASDTMPTNQQINEGQVEWTAHSALDEYLKEAYGEVFDTDSIVPLLADETQMFNQLIRGLRNERDTRLENDVRILGNSRRRRNKRPDKKPTEKESATKEVLKFAIGKESETQWHLFEIVNDSPPRTRHIQALELRPKLRVMLEHFLNHKSRLDREYVDVNTKFSRAFTAPDISLLRSALREALRAHAKGAMESNPIPRLRNSPNGDCWELALQIGTTIQSRGRWELTILREGEIKGQFWTSSS